MNLKLGDGVKIEYAKNGTYAICYVERIIYGPDIVLLSNNKWYSLESVTIKHGRVIYMFDELVGDVERATLVIYPRKKDLPHNIMWANQVDDRPFSQIQDSEIVQ